jgi:putative ABC transport system permease protein
VLFRSGRTLSLPTARLLRGLIDDQQPLAIPARTALMVSTVLLILLLLVLIPEPLIGLAFITVLALLLALLQLTVKGIRAAAGKLSHHSLMEGRLELRLASASLSGVHSSLRPMLLSIGTALTLLVAASSIIAATVHSLDTSIPSRAPSLVLYDLPETDREAFAAEVRALDGFQDLTIAPLVLGRLTQVNGQALSDSVDTRVALEANDEHKLSYRSAGIDNISVDRGEWWPEDYAGPALVAMEDREADQTGLSVGDQLTFTIMGTEVQATLAVIYSQANFETSFWLEAVFTPEVLDPFIDRHIGSIRLATDSDIPAMDTLGAVFPGVVIIRTAKILEAARSILAGASLGVFAIALVSLTASILVMASVVAVNRQRQVYEASVMHALGTRMRVVLRAVSWEYALLAAILTLFATALGSLIAFLVLEFWLELPVQYAWLAGLVVAAFASSACLLAGWLWLVRSLSATPAELLRRAA